MIKYTSLEGQNIDKSEKLSLQLSTNFTTIEIEILGKIKYSLIILLLNFGIESNAQITWDSTGELSRHESRYGQFKPSLKFSTYYDGNIGFEISRVRNNLSLTSFLNNTATKFYGLSWSINPNYKYGLIGINAGADIDFSLLHLGINGLIQSDFEKTKFYFIPNVGFSWWGTFGIYYGFKINLGEDDFIGNNDYLIGLKYNFTKNLFREFKNGVDL